MWRGIQIWSCFGEKRRFANFLHLVQLLCQGPSLYRQCYSILNLVSTFSHIYGAVCVCACHFLHSWASRHGLHALCNILSLYVEEMWSCRGQWRDMEWICGLYSGYPATLIPGFSRFLKVWNWFENLNYMVFSCGSNWKV